MVTWKRCCTDCRSKWKDFNFWHDNAKTETEWKLEDRAYQQHNTLLEVLGITAEEFFAENWDYGYWMEYAEELTGEWEAMNGSRFPVSQNEIEELRQQEGIYTVNSDEHLLLFEKDIAGGITIDTVFASCITKACKYYIQKQGLDATYSLDSRSCASIRCNDNYTIVDNFVIMER